MGAGRFAGKTRAAGWLKFFPGMVSGRLSLHDLVFIGISGHCPEAGFRREKHQAEWSD